MNRILIATIFTALALFAYQQISFAACGGATPVFFCNDSPPNPDPNGIQQSGNNNNLTVNVFPGAGIDVDPGSCVATGNGADDIDVNGGDLTCNSGVRAGGGNDTIDVTDSEFDVRDDGVATGSGNNTVNIVRSNFSVLQDDGVDAPGGVNIINITDSTIVLNGSGEGIQITGTMGTVSITGSEIVCSAGAPAACNAIDAGNGVDNVTIVESKLSALTRAIELGGGDDTLTFGTGADIDGLIDCQSGNADTVIFAMDVPEEALPFISSEIAALTPTDSITINGLTYDFEDCEFYVNQLNGVRVVRPIPTLSEWGLIAMAGLLGIVGFVVFRRRYKTA